MGIFTDSGCDCWRKKLVVSCIPQGTTRTNLYRLFQSVVQVQDLKYLPLQGKAVLTLHDSSSSDFVLQQEWQVSGSAVTVRRSKQCHSYCHMEKYKQHIAKDRKVTAEKSCVIVSSYKLWKIQGDAFWSDIPHEKCQPVKKKKRLKRKTAVMSKRNIPEVRDFVKKKMRSSKRRNHQEQVKNSNCDVQETELSEEKTKQPFHLYVKYNGVLKVEFEGAPSFSELKNKILQKSNVPLDLQIITHHGKLLRPGTARRLWSSDTVHLLVRGKGGMQAAVSQPCETQKCGIEKTALVKDVKMWLLNVVRVPAKYIENNNEIQFLSGNALFLYKNPQELKEECSIPIGISKKILYLRNNPSMETIDNIPRCALEAITPGNIQHMVKESFKDDRYDQIAEALVKEEVDAYVVMLYDDPQSFAKDLGIPKVASRALLSALKSEITVTARLSSDPFSEGHQENKSILEKEPTESNVKGSSFTASSVQATDEKDVLSESEHVSAGQYEAIDQISFPRGVNPTSDEKFLQSLGFERPENTDETASEQCDLVAIHNAWKQENPNVLAKSFLFWILCKNKNDLQNPRISKKLWESICMNTCLWIDILPSEQSKLFKPIKSQGTFQYRCSKTVKLGMMGASVKCFSTVSQEIREKYNCHILIIHDSVESKSFEYIDVKHRKLSLRYDIQNQNPFVYYSDGRIEKMKPKQESAEVEQTKKEENKPKDSQSETVKRGGGDVSDMGNIQTGTECVEEELVDTNSVTSDCLDCFGQQMPRQFKHDGSNTVYIKGYVVNRPECGSEMIIPSLEFKYFRLAVEKGEHVKKFLAETLRFACGCLNRRRNGTIYFGVADDKVVEGQSHKHGEIVGFPIVDIDSEISKSLFTDKLDHAKQTYFVTNKVSNAVAECISSPRFVLVQPSPKELPLYVMEVDIEPSFVFCEGVTFKVNLSKFGGQNKPVLYVRDGSSTNAISDKLEEDNFNLTLEKFDLKRKQEEEVMSRANPVRSRRKYLTEKLCVKLCKGTQIFDQSLWAILVSTKPTFEGRNTLFQTLPFISNIRWSAVLDFDNESFINGLCQNFFSGLSTNHVISVKFRHISNTDKFRSELGLPEKTLYIFCNGRSDLNMPYLTEKDWENEYFPGVKGAINFLQQESIIPVGRAIVIFLLLSSNTEGFLDTFKEIKTYFKLENIIMLCEDETVFDVFKQAAVQRNIVSAKELDECSIVGMTWEQASNVFHKLLGHEQKSVTLIPSSTRSDVEVNRQFLEGLECLSILGSTECETREFESEIDEKQFAHSKDLKFYQGNRVEWWNFHFQGQVVERSCFESLREKVEEALRGDICDNQAVWTIYLTHEPGAGGSTLARNILWCFRKKHRCAVVTKLEEKTANDIIDLWKYKEREEDCLPALLLIDSLAVQDIELFQLHRLIGKEMLKKFQKTPLVCVFLVCNRDGELKASNPNAQNFENNERLFQKLDKREQKLFKNKILELENTSADLGLVDFKREHFLSFMILHSNFNQEYIKSTVKTLLETMDIDGNAMKLIMCVALFVAYVSPPKGSAPISIPLECCNELMGHTVFMTRKTKMQMWEDHLERAVKILLIIEPKENGSGKEIRMAHPTLAREVIDYLKEKFQKHDRMSGEVNSTPLSCVVMRVLESELLQSASYALKFVYGLVVQMLTKRKKEEYGDIDNSKFSPLIESIHLEHPKTCKPAASVLQKALEIIQDGCIAQQLARLYLHHHDFMEAKTSAEKAVQLNPNRSPFIHTLGHVFKETFRTSKVYKGQLYLTPDNEKLKEEMQRIFRSLDLFEKASWCENELNLFACLDTLETVNIIVEFIDQNLLRSDQDKEEFHRYLTEERYIFEYIDQSLKIHRSGFKNLFHIGTKAIHDLDEHIYFKVKIYASQFNSRFNQEHRTSRAIKRRLPKLIKIFTGYFGENVDIDSPPLYAKSEEMQDEWHRRCVLSLVGKRLIGACDVVVQCRRQKKPLEMATATLEKAFKHLIKIQSKEPEDLLNLITVNFAALHLHSKTISTSMKDLLEYCKYIIDRGSKRQKTTAYMFAVMLLWPRQGIKPVDYDNMFMEKAVKYLRGAFKESRQPRSAYEVEYGEVFKRENNTVHSVPLFFEGKGKGMSCLWYQDMIFGDRHFQEMRDDIWLKQVYLRPVKGVTQIGPGGAVSVLVDSNEFEISHQIMVTAFHCKKPASSQQHVTFYLGFSMYGPAVCYILEEKGTFSRSSSYIDNSEYDGKSENELQELLHRIQVLRMKSELSSHEQKLLQDEDLVRDALMQFEKGIDFVD